MLCAFFFGYQPAHILEQQLCHLLHVCAVRACLIAAPALCCAAASRRCCRDYTNAAIPWGEPDWPMIHAMLPSGPEGASNVLSVSFDHMTYPVTVDGIHTVRGTRTPSPTVPKPRHPTCCVAAPCCTARAAAELARHREGCAAALSPRCVLS